jgi:hypothetical protein
MMGRVVQDIRLPLHRFAPVEPLDHASPRHNPQDILPTIVPKPNLSINRKEILESATTKELNVALTQFFGINFARSSTEKAELEGQQVKRYSLNQPKQVFKHLMKNNDYAKDVRELLAESKGRSYMVVGFMTTSGAVWKLSSEAENKTGFTATVPLSLALGTPPQLDPSISPSMSTKHSPSRTMSVVSEEIFAIAYDIVSTLRKLDFSAPGYVRKEEAYGKEKRAKAHHLALGEDSDEELEFESEDEDEKQPGLAPEAFYDGDEIVYSDVEAIEI